MGSDLGEVEEKQATFFSLLLPWAALGSRPETQLLKGFSPCCLACSPEISAASDGYMEHIYGKSGQLWQDLRYEYIPSDSVISLYPRRKFFLQRYSSAGDSPRTWEDSCKPWSPDP